jgi:3-oxoacyl-[acyl-carrier protein] reductase
MDLHGAVAIVTGGGSGIGRATALSLVEQKAMVVVCGRRREALDETARLVAERGGQALALAADVRKRAHVDAVAAAALERFGRVDVLVNNAGVAFARPVTETAEADWDDILETNLKGVFLCSKAVLPSMAAAGRGLIVNVASTLGLEGLANFGAYCASKFGVIGLTEAMADECRGTGIRIYAVCPGRTATAMQRQLGGEELARVSLPPRYVAEKIVALMTGGVALRSGGTLLVDEQGLGMRWLEMRRSCRAGAARWLGPVRGALRRARALGGSA